MTVSTLVGLSDPFDPKKSGPVPRINGGPERYRGWRQFAKSLTTP
jgi:hypothetical protein